MRSVQVTIPLAPANWRTTMAGLVGAIAIAVEPVLVAGVWDKDRLIMAAAVGLVGWLAKDAGVSGTEK